MESKELVLTEQKIEIDMTEIDSDRSEIMLACSSIVAINNEDEYKKAGELIVRLKGKSKAIDNLFKPFVEKIADVKRKVEGARKSIVDTQAQITRDYEVEDSRLRGLAEGFYRALEEKKRAEERKAQEERFRAEAEARRKADDEAIKRAEATGDITQLDKPEYVAPVVIVPTVVTETPKVAGLSFATVWLYRASREALDPAYTTLDDLGFVVPDHKKIKAIVTAMKEGTKITGVEAYSDTQSRAR